METKWDPQLREVAAQVDVRYVFAAGIWFIYQMECMKFSTKHITEWHFQWLFDIVRYSHLVTGETVSKTESQRDDANASKVCKTKYKSNVISAFKTDVPPILGDLSEGKESTTPLTLIGNLELCNTHNVMRGVYTQASKYLVDQNIKLRAGIDRELGNNMEATLLVSNLLGKCGVLWSHLAA